MSQPNLKIAKLNNNRYEISVESEHGILKCFVRAKLYGDKGRAYERGGDNATSLDKGESFGRGA